MLGPSMIYVGVPVSLFYAVQASRKAPDRAFAMVALVLSILEGLAVVANLVMIIFSLR